MSSEKKMIVLRSSDKETFEVLEAAALQSETLKHMIEDTSADTVIPIPNVTAKILSKVLEYCNRQAGVAAAETSGNLGDEAFRADFVKDLDPDALLGVLLAANYLCIKSLLDLTCQAVADKIKDYTVEQCRAFFNVENDYTEEEEREVRKEHEWAHEI